MILSRIIGPLSIARAVFALVGAGMPRSNRASHVRLKMAAKPFAKRTQRDHADGGPRFFPRTYRFLAARAGPSVDFSRRADNRHPPTNIVEPAAAAVAVAPRATVIAAAAVAQARGRHTAQQQQ